MVRLRVRLAAVLLASGPALAQHYHSEKAVTDKLGGVQFSPYAGRTYPTRSLSGDQRLHTEISVDAGTMCRLGQEDAYRFARGEEVTQIKGDGESHPLLSPNDEFADYETWDDANLDRNEVKTLDMLHYGHARSALKIGLVLEKKPGVNPFKFGIAAGTDARTVRPAVEKNNCFGKHSGVEPEPAPRGSRRHQVALGY
jgi:hypothetical protein